MKLCYALFSLVVMLFCLIALADLTAHFGVAQKLSSGVFFLLVVIFIIRVLRLKKDEK